MKNIIKKEEEICRLLDSKNPYAMKALDNLLIRFDRDDHLRPTVHPILINAIYFERDKKERWKLNPKCNICDTTGNRYRKMYIRHFFYFYEKNKALAEAAATFGA